MVDCTLKEHRIFKSNMKEKEIILAGGGGHCMSVIESLEHSGGYRILGISDLEDKKGRELLGYKVLWSDQQLALMISETVGFLVTLGHIKTPIHRRRVFESLKAINALIYKHIDVDAIVSSRALIGDGTVVLRKAFVNAGAVVGENCIINSGAMVEHSSIIGNHVHISTGVIINGDCTVGDGCFVGSGAIVSNGVNICANTLIGAGSVVYRDITRPGTYMGNPVRFVK